MDGTDVMGEGNVRGAVWLRKARPSSTAARVGWSKPILSRIAHEHDLEQQASELILQGHDNARDNLRAGWARTLPVPFRSVVVPMSQQGA